jgi:hypothetical protein
VATSLKVSSVFEGRPAPGVTHPQHAATKKSAALSVRRRSALPIGGEGSRPSIKRPNPRLS